MEVQHNGAPGAVVGPGTLFSLLVEVAAGSCPFLN